VGCLDVLIGEHPEREARERGKILRHDISCKKSAAIGLSLLKGTAGEHRVIHEERRDQRNIGDQKERDQEDEASMFFIAN
jgi:hypothetical protein